MTKLALLLTLLALPVFAQDVPPMDPKADPSFEVATINPSRPTSPNDENSGFHIEGHRIFVERQTLASMLSVAYHLHRDQIIGGPAWLTKDLYDIHGVPDLPGQPNIDQFRKMLQKLLADRFQIAFHHDQRELSIYTVTVLKSGPRLHPTKMAADALPNSTRNDKNNRQESSFENCTMALFAEMMQFVLPRPVIDHTNLTGKYDFKLVWTPDTVPNPAPDAPPGLFTAIQEQLGLKLEATRAPAPVLIIDHVERPSNN